MTNPTLAHRGHPLPHDLAHCPLCGGELQSGTNDRAYECPACEYTEQEVAA
jgi:tRNA(Ile2) C34 agmatinyltransferase TiaS